MTQPGYETPKARAQSYEGYSAAPAAPRPEHPSHQQRAAEVTGCRIWGGSPYCEHRRDDTDRPVTAPELTPTERKVVDRFDAAEAAPESYDGSIWATLTDLLPCHPDMDCADECECTSGQTRLAIERLILRERTHMADCEGDVCGDRSHALALRVEALAMTR